MNSTGSRELWEHLRAKGVVRGEMPPAEAGDAWYVALTLGIAGWIAAAFLLSFVGAVLAPALEIPLVLLPLGATLLCIAATILRGPAKTFAAQFGFALSLTGQGVVALGLHRLPGMDSVLLGLLLTVIQLTLFFVVSQALHRVWSAATGALALAWAFSDIGLLPVMPAVLALALVTTALNVYLLPKRGLQLRDASRGFALALALVVLSVALTAAGTGLHAMTERHAPAWFGGLLAGAVLVWAVVPLLARAGLPLSSTAGRRLLVLAMLPALASVLAPGLAPALLVLLLGHGNSDRVLRGFGVLFLLLYLAHYYYALQVTLLEKSLLLLCTGVALLLARVLLRRHAAAAGGRDA